MKDNAAMKQVFYSLIFFHFFVQADPLLVAVLMVKNEQPVMEMTLQPLVDAGITDFLIYDTGSTDKTIEVTHEFFAKNNISNYVIKQGPWIDFATCRNQALDLTEQHFPNATFMLMLDAEWILHNGKDLLQFCEQYKDDCHVLYMIQVRIMELEFGHLRLIRTKKNVRFVGRVHEVPNIAEFLRIPFSIYFQLPLTHYGKEKSKQRWIRDRDILLQEAAEYPDHPRTIFYLAQTYFCLEEWQEAIKYFQKRVQMQGWDEERFMSYISIAQANGMLNNIDAMIENYLAAFQMRPCRAEPLIRLAEFYCNHQQYELSYLFARHAITIQYPYYEIGLVEKRLYDFVRYEILSQIAYVMGDYSLGKLASERALQVEPSAQYLYKNLKNYQKLLGEINA